MKKKEEKCYVNSNQEREEAKAKLTQLLHQNNCLTT
jgi:hypothetical protein